MVDVVRYPGGKNGCGTWQRIVSLMPPHEVYVEPFLGSGAVLRRKRPGRVNVGIDLDMQTVASVSAALAQNGEVCDRRSRLDEYGEAGSRVASIAKGGDARSIFRLVVGDAFRFLRSFKPTGRELIYLDPPYLLETRKSGRIYQHELERPDHVRLLEAVSCLKCMVVLSGYKSDLYREALEGWSHTTFSAMTRGGCLAQEWLWFNYAPPSELHDYRFLGEDFRARERMKRKINRWRSRLGRMDGLERQALLCALELR